MAKSNMIGGKPKAVRTTVQITDSTEKAKHVVKYTIYANPEIVSEVIKIALEKLVAEPQKDGEHL